MGEIEMEIWFGAKAFCPNTLIQRLFVVFQNLAVA